MTFRFVFCHGFLALIYSSTQAVDFNREIRPILADHCFTCHGPDASSRKAKLRLDDRDAALSKEAFVPNKPDESELVHRIFSDDPDEMMPPPEMKKPLTAEEKDILSQWIAGGAEYRGHWAFERVERPKLPKVPNRSQVRNPIDTFILSRLKQENLSPADEAPKHRLICRLSLDLTGLPPTPAEVDAFIHDNSPDAYEKLVDRLLDSPRYGEHMAVPWLDYSRYADSNGYQTDGSRYQWPWRDWLINALNRNLPYNQFTVEQLAGDLLPDATIDQKIATGFNRNHRINGEGGIIAEEWRIETVIDRVETTGATWLGLTLGCARCHDHKYDPFSQKEFYEFFSFFNNVPETGRLAGQSSNTKPLISVETPSFKAELKRLEQAVKDAEFRSRKSEAQIQQEIQAWLPGFRKQFAEDKPVWQPLDPESIKSTGGATFERQEDGSFLPTGKNSTHDTYVIRSPWVAGQFSGVLLECLPDDRTPNKSLGRYSNGNFVLTRVLAEIHGPGDQRTPVKLVRQEADYSQKGWSIKQVNDGNKSKGWAVDGPSRRKPIKAMFLAESPVMVAETAKLEVRLIHETLNQHNMGRFRLSATGASPATVGLGGPSIPPPVLAAAGAKKPDAQQMKVLTVYYNDFVAKTDTGLVAARKKLDEHRKSKLPTVMIMEEMPQPRKAFILNRGEYDHPGEEVSAALPAFLPSMPEGQPMNRLGLARWIAHRDNPLTARVWVNRAWEQFFGAGLVKSSENLGIQAAFPSHPKLLDWLAAEFMEPSQGLKVAGQPVRSWDMKGFHKLLVMSAAYRQSTRPANGDRSYTLDPENRLLSRGPRFRLSGEQVRDRALYVSGLLVEKQGGPSVRPYMPAGVWNETTRYGDLRNYKHETGEGLYRRTMYTFWKRTAAPPSMLLFDAPNREICTMKRSRTNTPLQALSLLNEVTFVEAARKLASRMLAPKGDSPDTRLRNGFRHTISRSPLPRELSVLSKGLAEDLAYFKSNPDAASKLLQFGESTPSEGDPAELAAYTLAANVLLNLDEFVTRE